MTALPVPHMGGMAAQFEAPISTRPAMPAPTATPAKAEPCPCELLTALVRVGRLVDAMPAETLAADDLWDELATLAESIEAARSHAEPLRGDDGRPAACPDDLRRRTRLTLALDLIHDIGPAELEAVVLARLEAALAGEDIDVAEVTSRWEARSVT